MMSLDAPGLENFTPVKAYSTLGVNYVRLMGPEDVRLDVSPQGAVAIEQDTGIADLVDRTGQFIAEHDGYRDTATVRDFEPGRIHAVADKYRHAARLASVYCHESAPNVIVKAYDFDHMSAAPQFYFGSWLHNKLASAADGLHSPRQIAMFTSHSGHRTVLMDRLSGESLREYAHFEAHISYEVAAAIHKSAHKRLGRQLGRIGKVVVNDLRDYDHIFLNDPEAITLDSVSELELGIIDQPVVRWSNVAPFGLTRLLC
jgi:hypothetical protein